MMSLTQRPWTWPLRVALGNLAIAVFLTGAGIGKGNFVENLIFSQCIGLSIYAVVYWPVSRMRPTYAKLVAAAAAILVGSVLGSLLGLQLTGHDPWRDGLEWARVMAQPVMLGLLFGIVAGNFFYHHERIALVQQDLEAERVRRLESERDRATAELKMLQAQIEPHFLFNTLAHVVSLLDQDVPAARGMLLQLIEFLRGALRLARQPATTLGEELGLVEAYLGLLRWRMGDRLQIDQQIDPAVLTLPFPPLLLQPLVENAIKHGLEPKIAGGTIRIQADTHEGMLHVRVADTGVGFAAGPTGAGGVGLSNIRSRLHNLYGGRAQFEILENPMGGVTSHIAIPLE